MFLSFLDSFGVAFGFGFNLTVHHVISRWPSAMRLSWAVNSNQNQWPIRRLGSRVIREVDSGANTPCWGAPAFIIFDTRFAKTQIILDISSKEKQTPEFQDFTTQTQANPSSKFPDPAPQANI